MHAALLLISSLKLKILLKYYLDSKNLITFEGSKLSFVWPNKMWKSPNLFLLNI